ncbi:histidinol-phosphatase [Cyclobacterium jeungdonense]|uniref:Histidinol-phosphatase n=1 Tax=Cyclobacterium jeungdonense TaxID=708087 RepID=A0ABT8CB51_9BACT|nr:histidinol-phosphatase [Cyclobacterium jeungdonense]MDN3689028.1 histidinol-phosphatase [Cyclobacterium jeungdonense]
MKTKFGGCRLSSLTWGFLLIFAGCSPQQSTRLISENNWYKGNLHTHSYWSDGDEFPEVIMKWYKDNGYQFVALSDHNIFQEGEKWVSIRQDSMYRNAFQNYLNEYSDSWVIYEKEGEELRVKLKTFDEYAPLYEEKEQFIMLPAEEISAGYEGKPLHLNATNIDQLIQPREGGSVVEVLQNNINAVLEQRQESGKPMMVHINHPNFRWAITLEDMIRLKGERFFEVYNGHPAVNNLGDSARLGYEEMWDFINIAYLEKGQPLLFGLATDDSHSYHEQSSKLANAGRGWVVVRAEELTPGALIGSLEKGDFYASTGVELEDVRYADNLLSIRAKPKDGVTYTLQFIGCKTGEKETTILKTVSGNEGEFEVGEDFLFVRCKIISSEAQENPVENMNNQQAWTQPVRPGGEPLGN